MFVSLGGLGDLAGDGEVTVVNVDADLVFGQAGKLEGGCHDVLVHVLV